MRYAASTVLREDWLRYVRAGLAHFQAFELACAEPRLSAAGPELRSLLRLKRRHGLAYSVHAPFRTLDIGSDVPALRRRTEALYARALDAAAAVEAGLVVMHPAVVEQAEWRALPAPRRRAVRGAEADAFGRLARRAESLGVRIGVENMPRYRAARDATWLQGLKASVPSAALGFTVDVGHSLTSGIAPALLLRTLGSDVYHVHVHDNGGVRDEHRPVGAGAVDWRSVAEALVGMDYRGLVADEALNLDSQVRGRDLLERLLDLAGRVRVLSAAAPRRA